MGFVLEPYQCPDLDANTPCPIKLWVKTHKAIEMTESQRLMTLANGF